MAKKLSKILWYGADKDASGKPIIPPLSPSIEKHLEGLNEGEIYIHNDDEYPALYIRTNKDKIVAIGGAEALMKYFLRKDQPDTAREVITFEKGLNVGEFVTGASGASFFKDLTTGQTIMELDKLYVRMKAFFETLTIVEAQTISGKQIISPAGSVRCTNVEEYDDYYRCYFLNEQDGEKIENKFIEGDQVYSQMFNAKTGTSNKISNRYYWRLVTGVGENYIDLSKTDCDADSDAPMVGDVLNQRGHRYPENSERMNFIETSTVDGFSPSITLFHGVNSFSLVGKDYVQFGVDKTTNKAFMNVYGDMYVGDRNKTAYMRYTQEEGLVICGKLDVGTKLGDSYLKDLIAASTPEGYQEFVDKVTQDLEGLQAQIDGTIDSYFFQYEPSLDNYPASEWDTEDEKKAHLNDTFTNLVDGRSWRWSLDGTYKWVEITDTATTKALALAGKAKDTADGKRRVFVVTDEHPTPYPPYDKGDLWSRGSNYPLLICVVPKESGVYAEGDFDYADNNAKLMEEMQTLVTDTKSELNNSIGQAKEAANKYADEGIASAKEDINASIAELEKAKANVTEVYSKAEADGKITEAETNAINASKAQADAAIALSETTIKAYADGIVDDEEAARIKQAQENLAEAKKYAEEQAQAAREEIKNSYLFQALQDAKSTEIDNGLVLTSLIQLRDTQSNIMSGINGLINASKGDKSIATWWGGDMLDLIDYYTWDGTQWVVKSGLTAPSNIPSGLIRMDGTGYLAKGKFWWDNDGKIYADPTALFLSFDVENEGASLSATILDIRDKQTEFANMWSLETDSNGTKYLYSKYPLVSQGGVTMYAGTSGLDVEGIYDGLPIDGSTIYWENGVLKARGGGGGVADSVAWADITGKPSFSTVATSGSYNDLLNKPTLLSSFTNDVGYLTEHQDLSGYQPLITSTNKLAYSLISGTPTIPTSLKSPYALTFGSKTYDGSAAKTITASDLGALTAHQTIYNLTMQAGAFSAVTFDPNGAAKTVNIPTTTSHISEGTNLYFTNARAVSALTSTLSGYLPLSGGTITGSGASLFTINRTDNQYVTTIYKYNGTELGKIGFAGSNNPSYWDVSQSTWRTLLHSGNYSSYALPLTGGTLTSNSYDVLTLKRNTSVAESGVALAFANSNGTICHIHSIESDKCLYRSLDNGGKYKIWDAGNLTKLSQLTNDSGFITSSASITGNAATATKLATARTIWGQSFDGSGNVTGRFFTTDDIFMNSGKEGIYIHDFSIDWHNSSNEFTENLLRFTSSGNIAVGNVDPKYKLHVNGTLNATTIYQNGSTLDSLLGAKLNSSSYTAADVLAKLKTVDGSGSGLDADTLDGYHSTNFAFKDASNAYSCYNSTSTNYYVLVAQCTTSSPSTYQHRQCVLSYGNRNGTGLISIFVNSSSSYNSNTFRIEITGNLSTSHVFGVKTDNGSVCTFSVYVSIGTYNGQTYNVLSTQGGFTFPNTYTTTAPTNVATRTYGYATQLSTARTIWGQSFDGTGNVSGDLHLSNNAITDLSSKRILLSDASNLYFGTVDANAYNTYVTGSSIALRYGSSSLVGFIINSSGNVGIGTANPLTPLHLSMQSTVICEEMITNTSSNSVGIGFGAKTSENLMGFLKFKMDTANTSSSTNRIAFDIYGHDDLFNILGNGNVGIGTTSPSYKLHVSSGDIRVDGWIRTYGDNGWYSEKYYGGWYMIDTTYVRSYTNKSVWIGNSLYIGTNAGAGTGLSLYGSSTPDTYGIHMSLTSSYGTHGSVTSDWATYLCTSGGTSRGFIFRQNGSNVASISGAGNMLLNGGITMYSDIRKKTKLKDVELSLKEIADAPLIEHYYNSDDKKTTHVGSIAQYWAGLNDWFCKLDNEGYYTMEIQNAALASSISIARELVRYESETDKQIRTLKSRVRELEEEVKRLRA